MKVAFGQDNQQLTGPIYDGICVRQEFMAHAESLVSIDVYFATYAKENPGEILVEILDQKQNSLGKATADSARLQDNAYREFGFGAKLVIGQKYELKLWTSMCRSGNSPTVFWGTKADGGHLFVGRNLMRGGELTCQFNYESVAPESVVYEPVEHLLPAGAISGLVSVVVPHYRCESYLQSCLVSLAKQRYSCIEVFVVDDGSEDQEAVKSIVEPFKGILPSLTFVPLPSNQGAPVARNAGAAFANGEYLFFCDADVSLYPASLEVLVRSLIGRPRADFAYGGFYWGGVKVEPIQFNAERLRQRNYVTTMSLLRRAKFPGWDERLKRHQDWDLWLSMVDKGSEGVCCGQYLFETPIREGSISSGGSISVGESMAIVAEKHELEAYRGRGD